MNGDKVAGMVVVIGVILVSAGFGLAALLMAPAWVTCAAISYLFMRMAHDMAKELKPTPTNNHDQPHRMGCVDQ